MKCKELLSEYFDALKGGSACAPLPSGHLSIVVPFLYPDHDNVEIFIKENAKTIVVSDLGETLRRLDTIGIDMQASGRIAYQVERIASGFQVNLEDGALFKEGDRHDFGALAFDVISACMAVGDLAYTSRAWQPLTFEDEVEKLLAVNDFEFKKGHTVKGRSQRDYKIDFMITTLRRVSYVQAMEARTSSGVRAWVNATVVMWSDIETVRSEVVRKVSVLNDETSEIKDEDIRLLGRDSTVYRWNEQQQFISSLRNGKNGKGKKTKAKSETM